MLMSLIGERYFLYRYRMQCDRAFINQYFSQLFLCHTSQSFSSLNGQSISLTIGSFRPAGWIPFRVADRSCCFFIWWTDFSWILIFLINSCMQACISKIMPRRYYNIAGTLQSTTRHSKQNNYSCKTKRTTIICSPKSILNRIHIQKTKPLFKTMYSRCKMSCSLKLISC